jgi:hypothetical protein
MKVPNIKKPVDVKPKTTIKTEIAEKIIFVDVCV